ncbi:hypothetical protein NDU88_002746 [Pleurodeles waltl]|uniref:Uncharacterized protein n=1 Tax=Pleurodeles waltl TaxID=8319 RepID=A0AAV7W395_PLEWA|nr:hypothetical protein NDU88_002746 [Pleurodeles waltl]
MPPSALRLLDAELRQDAWPAQAVAPGSMDGGALWPTRTWTGPRETKRSLPQEFRTNVEGAGVRELDDAGGHGREGNQAIHKATPANTHKGN